MGRCHYICKSLFKTLFQQFLQLIKLKQQFKSLLIFFIMIIVANAREALPSVLSFIYNSTNLALYILIFLLSANQSVLFSLFSFLGNKQSIYIIYIF